MHEQPDPLRARETFSHRALFYPLGFALLIETNSPQILAAAQESWSEHTALPGPLQTASPLRLRIGVKHGPTMACPPPPSIHAFDHLLSIIASAEDSIICDLREGFAFGWLSESTLRHPSYARYFFLEAAVMCLLAGSRVTPIHAGCINRNGRGLLLCGESGAGKSTLAYACARAGFAFTTDDASYLVWYEQEPRVRGNAHQVRFRPAARDLFPELRDRTITSRPEGKPSIEVRTAELGAILKAPDALVHTVLMLRRSPGASPAMQPISSESIIPYLKSSLFPMGGIHERQVAFLQPLLQVEIYEFRYSDLNQAVSHLKHWTDSK